MRRLIAMTCVRCGKVRELRKYDLTKTRSHGALCQPCASVLFNKKRAFRKGWLPPETVDERLAELTHDGEEK